MSSYQSSDEESLNTLRTQIQILSDDVDINLNKKPFQNILKYSLACSMVIVLGIFTYTSYSGEKSYSALVSTKNTSPIGANSVRPLNLAMAKEGSLQFSMLNDVEVSTLFQEFKTFFGKTYESDEEESSRFLNFKTFLTVVDTRNAKEQKNGGRGKHSITQFADLETDEFKSKFLGFRPTTVPGKLPSTTVDESYYTDLFGSSTTPTLVNWADILTTAVKDQGYCGSCWAFSATEQVESDAIRSGLLTTADNLSPQQLVSCDTYAAGCSGGSTELAYYYIYSAGGVALETTYPYTSYFGSSSTCESKTKSVTVSNYYTVSSESAMKSHVQTTGPLSVCLDASEWASYSSGVLSSCGTEVDHCVQVVGINTADNYWIVRNSWGTTWGNSGYIYLQYGSDLCSISYDPTFVKAVVA